MNRIFAGVLVLLLTMNSAAMNYRKVAEKDMKASVLLHMKGFRVAKGGIHRVQGGCSGTFVDPTHILTAAHCFEGYTPVWIWARGPDEILGYPVHLVRLMGAKDLALLESPFPHPYVKIGNSPRLGDEVLNIGSPYDFEFVVSQGIVGLLGFHMQGFTAIYLLTTAMINPGSSGGGCFNRKGELVGVNVMTVGMFGWSGISLAVDGETVKEFLQ